LDERSARVLRAVTATVSGDTSSVSELFTEDVIAASPTASVSSRVELAVELEDHEDDVSEVEVEVDAEAMTASGDRVCAEWTASATYSEVDRVADAGRPRERRVTLRGVTVAEFEGDRISAVRHYWNEWRCDDRA
jgi:hypothetical protein